MLEDCWTPVVHIQVFPCFEFVFLVHNGPSFLYEAHRTLNEMSGEIIRTENQDSVMIVRLARPGYRSIEAKVALRPIMSAGQRKTSECSAICSEQCATVERGPSIGTQSVVEPHSWLDRPTRDDIDARSQSSPKNRDAPLQSMEQHQRSMSGPDRFPGHARPLAGELTFLT